MESNHTNEGRWKAVIAREARSAEPFVYAVDSTGIYCRPDCPSRRPKRENVRFFAGPAEAEAAGFRPCRRCRPEREGPDATNLAVRRACALAETAEEPPSLTQMASAAGLSPSHFHRSFTRLLGVTPKQYVAALRARRLRNGLGGARSVTQAAFDSGYGASSRMYAQAETVLGMKPNRYRKGGTGERIRYATAPCSLGLVLVAATAKGICAISLGDDVDGLETELRGRFGEAELTKDPDFLLLLRQVVALVDEPGHAVELPLDIRGTAFQQKVWQALRAVPPGTTVTYGELARRIGHPGAVRAVGSACARNAIGVAVPCHRAIREDGTLGGYRWGLHRKRALLAKEANDSSE